MIYPLYEVENISLKRHDIFNYLINLMSINYIIGVERLKKLSNSNNSGCHLFGM